VRAYTAAVALWPRTPQVYFNRGLAYFRMQQYQPALADFQKVLDLAPGHGEALVQRALTKQGLRDLAAAEADLTAALKTNVSSCRIYFLRAKVREEAEDFVGAKQDLLEGNKLDPVSDIGYTTRGYALMGSKPQLL